MFQRAARKLGRHLIGPPPPPPPIPPPPPRIDLVDADGLSVFMYTNDHGYYLEPHERRHYSILSHSADLDAGRKPACPPDDQSSAQVGKTLRHIMRTVWASGHPCDYIDVGAHYGVTSMHMAAHIKAHGMACRVFAFECGKAADLAPKNITLNRLDDIITFERKAVAHMSIPQLLTYEQTHLEAGSIVTNSQPAADASYVADAVTLDGYFSGCDRQLLAKIDVEGGEPLVLAGAKQLMCSSLPPAVIMEYHPPNLMRDGADPSTILDAYADDFSLFAFEPAPTPAAISPPAATVYEVAPDAMDSLTAHIMGTARLWCDILLLPKSAAFYDETRRFLEKASNYVTAPF